MQRPGWVAAVLAGMMTAPSAAYAAPPLACDYYQNLVLGTLCQGTMDVGLSIDNDHRENDQSFGDSYVQGSTRYTYDFLDLGASVSVTPLRWLKLTVGSNVTTQSNGYSYYQTGVFGQYQSSSSSRHTYAGLQTLTALANVLDTQIGTAHYVVNGYVTYGFVPGTGVGNTPSQVNAQWHTEWYGGVEGNGQWRLPGGAYSIVGRAGLRVLWQEADSETVVQPALTVLLSNDAWGVAVGPTAYVNILTSANDGVGPDPDAVYVGGEIRAQPLRMVPVPVLRDMTATIDVVHSVGQSDWVNPIYGNVSNLIVTASLAWHFYY